MSTRVAFVTSSPVVWGAETSLELLIDGLKAFDVDCSVILSPESPFATVLSSSDVKYCHFDFATSGNDFKSLSSFNAIAKINLLLRVALSGLKLAKILRDYDLVVIFAAWQGFETLLAAKMARKPVVFDLHETFASGAAKKMVRVICRASDLTVVPSQTLRNFFDLPVTRDIRRIPRIMPELQQADGPARAEGAKSHAEERRAPRPDGGAWHFEGPATSKNLSTILMLGQVQPHKRVLNAVRLMAELVPRRTRLLVVGGTQDPRGRTSYECDVRAAASASTAVEIIDRTDDPANFLMQADFVINISEHEAFGRTVIEGLLHGASPIVLAQTGPAEIVQDVGAGIILDHLGDLANLIRQIDSGLVKNSVPDAQYLRARLARYTSQSVSADYANLLADAAGRGDTKE